MNDLPPPRPPYGGGPATPAPPDQGGGDRRDGRLAAVVETLRTRPAARRTLSTLSILLFLAGAGMFAFPFITDIYADQVVQDRLDDEFGTDAFREQYVTRTVATGDPLTRITIPKLAVKAMVVEGTSSAALRAGAGHYPNTPLPGEDGNVAIAGHRTTYGKPFARLDELQVGDKVELETPLAVHTYRVVGPPANTSACASGGCWITHPKDWGAVAPTEEAMLTLTTCHPKGSARQRLIVRAELIDSVERAPAAPQGDG